MGPYDGHAPGHLRTAFEVWLDDPTQAQVEVGWHGERHTVDWLFEQLSNCTDVLPALIRERVNRLLAGEPDDFRNTYGAAVQRLSEEALG